MALIIVALIIGLNLYGYLSKRAEIKKFPDYYQSLAEQCLQKTSYGCCIASIRAMENGSYKLIPKTGCQEGFRGNGLECIDSFGWCEPITK